tara:strand:+ start:98 stop:556 length:459 start_codon:yes stop_codon:yes gene_type:complete
MYKCKKCDFESENKQSYCAHQSHCGNTKRDYSKQSWAKGLTKETDERIAKMAKAVMVVKKDPSKISPVQSWRKRRKVEFVNQLGGECKVCGYKKCVEVLCFHHIDPETKSFSITSALANPKKKELIQEEVNKCILLCANCHGEYHSGLIELK